MIVELADPLFGVFEGSSIGEGKCKNNSHAALKIGLGQRFELLLSCGIPDL